MTQVYLGSPEEPEQPTCWNCGVPVRYWDRPCKSCFDKLEAQKKAKENE